jgi:hypothetical protein
MISKASFTKVEADEIVNLIMQKLKSDTTKQKGIRNKIRKLGFYASEYGFRDGYTVEQFLSVAKIGGVNSSFKQTPTAILAKTNSLLKTSTVKPAERKRSDESYVIDLCDEVLKQQALRQHRFDFLRGDTGTKLPVDAYYQTLNIVVEFMERQHTEQVKFFDRRQTVSGVGRGEQRKLYDQRRREVVPQNGIVQFCIAVFR